MAPESPDAVRDRLLEAARQAMQHAYAPYSNFKVGAALLTESGEVFTGSNVENASYGLTNCAERTAIFTAVAQRGADRVKLRAIAVVNSQNAACSPCGACRQVMHEFGPGATVWFQGPAGIETSTVEGLLPSGFRLKTT